MITLTPPTRTEISFETFSALNEFVSKEMTDWENFCSEILTHTPTIVVNDRYHDVANLIEKSRNYKVILNNIGI